LRDGIKQSACQDKEILSYQLVKGFALKRRPEATVQMLGIGNRNNQLLEMHIRIKELRSRNFAAE
jgi:hypothetical protein